MGLMGHANWSALQCPLSDTRNRDLDTTVLPVSECWLLDDGCKQYLTAFAAFSFTQGALWRHMCALSHPCVYKEGPSRPRCLHRKEEFFHTHFDLTV